MIGLLRILASQPCLTDPDPADGLGRHSHDIWLPSSDEAAPFDQASAHRVDYEGPLILLLYSSIVLCSGLCGGQLEIPSPGTLGQGWLTADSNSVEDLPSLLSHLALQVSASYHNRSTHRAPRAQYNVNQNRRTTL
ncbi:hypothetical protein BGY98DRAFT_1001721 [Russula aff. rugulosa BPL654]|nr:hypothetical protein BGY98DRAFT_1001721 [Russula aff. rugulosa BPL654]